MTAEMRLKLKGTNDALKVTPGLPRLSAFAITPSVHNCLEPDAANSRSRLYLPGAQLVRAGGTVSRGIWHPGKGRCRARFSCLLDCCNFPRRTCYAQGAWPLHLRSSFGRGYNREPVRCRFAHEGRRNDR